MTTTHLAVPAQRVGPRPIACYAGRMPSVGVTQSAEAANALKVVQRFFSQTSTARGNSRESAQVVSSVLELARGEDLTRIDESEEFISYGHLRVKPAFSVKATYKHVGKLKPRKFSVDE